MNGTFRLVALCLLTCAFVTVGGTTLLAGDASTVSGELPVDTALRVGRLDNGLTYYIRHNEEPRGRADMWLVQKTGSLVEEEDERGLAHFIEHMAFNGTEHFPGIDMVTCLQDNGVSYGRDINASTGFDDTQFKISRVPTSRESLLDTVLLMLRDLSCNITMDSAAIERERGVIEQEWLSNADNTMRMYETALPILMSGSRYASRIAIGDMNVVRHVTHEQLLAFYRRWYCPSRQAVVIVGDVDPDRMEQSLRRVFADLPSSCGPDAPASLSYVGDHAGVTYALHTDPEASHTMVYLFFEHQSFPRQQRNTMAFLRHNLVSTLVQNMLAERLADLARSAQSPLDYATVYDRQFLVCRSRDALAMAALCKQGCAMQTLDTLMVHAARAVQHGFTADELQRACDNARSAFSSMLDEEQNHSNGDYVQEYIDHYENGGYIPGVAAECGLLLDQLQQVTLADVNAWLRQVVGKDNVSVLVSGPQSPIGGGSTYPTSREVIAHFSQAINSPQSPLPAHVASQELLDHQPKPGRIIDEHTDPQTGITTMTLGNGATVRLKPTTWRNSEVLLNAWSPGGEWVYGDTAGVDVRLMDMVIENCALGGHGVNDLHKLLSGRQLGLVFSIGDPAEQLSGGCVSADIETLLQLCYLYFTDVSIDPQAFQALKGRIRSQVTQASGNPRQIFSDSIGSTLYCGNPMYRSLSASDVDSLDAERCLQLYRQRVANAGDFSFSLVGAFTIEEMRPLIKRYIASLPDGGRRERLCGGYMPPMATGQVENRFSLPMSTPRSHVYVSLMGDRRYSYDDELMINLAGQAIGAALLTYLRQERHAVYDVAADGVLSMYHHRWILSYEFQTDPARCDSVMAWAEHAMQTILTYGVSQELFDALLNQAISQHDASLQTNAYWLRALQQQAMGVDIVGGFNRMLPTLTCDALNAYIRTLLPHTRVRVVMDGQ